MIRQTIDDLVSQNIRVHLLDDASDDGSDAAVRDLIDRGAVIYERLPPAPGAAEHQFTLERILSRKIEIAVGSPAAWILNHDADEFRESPWAGTTLRQGIELVDQLGYNAIDFEVLNFWPTHDRWTPASDLRSTFTCFETGPSFDRLQVRCWNAGGRAVDLLTSAGHEASFEGRRVFPIRFLLRHYPVRSQAHGIRKILQDRVPRFAASERARGWHVQYDNLGLNPVFIKDPATMTPFDAAVVRVALQARNRNVESLEREVSEVRETFERERALRDRELQTLTVASGRLRRRLDESLSRERRLEQRIDDERRRTREASAVVDSQEAAIERLTAALATERRSAEHLAFQLEAIRTSWSWRLTAPVRRLLEPFMK